MKDFMLLFRGGMDFKTATPEQMQTAMQNWRAWTEQLVKAGRYVNDGNRLKPEGAVISGKKKGLIDGPYTEGKEMVGGFRIIRARDLADAIEAAKDCPIFENNGLVEVREVIPAPTK